MTEAVDSNVAVDCVVCELATATQVVQGRPVTRDGVLLAERRFGVGEDAVGEEVGTVGAGRPCRCVEVEIHLPCQMKLMRRLVAAKRRSL